jgi:hypothetical protein
MDAYRDVSKPSLLRPHHPNFWDFGLIETPSKIRLESITSVGVCDRIDQDIRRGFEILFDIQPLASLQVAQNDKLVYRFG